MPLFSCLVELPPMRTQVDTLRPGPLFVEAAYSVGALGIAPWYGLTGPPGNPAATLFHVEQGRRPFCRSLTRGLPFSDASNKVGGRDELRCFGLPARVSLQAECHGIDTL
jgi:hypothetical protein